MLCWFCKTNFPKSKLLDADGNFIGHRVYSDVDPTILNTLTFGLFGGNTPKPQAVEEEEEEQAGGPSLLNTMTFGWLGDDGEPVAPEPPVQ